MGTEYITRCIICGSELISDHIQCIDHFVTQESFMISKCNDCGFCFTNPRPDIDSIAPYYESKDYISHSKIERGLTNRLFHIARHFTIRAKAGIVRKYSSGNNLLDYGCGTGEFLHFMNKKAYMVRGVEPNSLARKHAIDTYSLDVFGEGDIKSIPDGSLNAITLWHVLEHIYPLEERIKQFHQKLNTDGTLFVALPNINSYDAKKYKNFWAAFDVPRHIYHFTPETIKPFMNNFGFSHVASKPMRLDAFYISMLSEKYLNGSSKNINAVITGLKSNMSAYWGKKNYSSLIYIFKKLK